MGALALLAGGCACGVAAASPLLLQMRHGNPNMGKGVAGVIAAFAVIQLALFVVQAKSPQLLVPFAVVAVLSFILCVLVEAIRSSMR